MNDTSPLSDDIGFLLTRAGALTMGAANKALAPFDLKVRSFSVLVLACEHATGLGQRQIAEKLGLDPSQIVALVDDLESRGFIARQVNPEDRRNKRVSATNEGRRLCAEAQSEVASSQNETLGGLLADDVDSLRAKLQAIVHDRS
ncbi:MarR family winged helix-turn-helix transcriptional regulator [Rhodococcoides fascians]|uniref:MarR family winged helix-turn-helix transcriptional regulator n=1 Tax=Rhodococcoides fascians TaxID=1828 RepID=UPI00056C33EA|nr:MarR family transcriptional regulator [Rhodococcus fascians]